ncbi:condensin subunit Smc [Pelagirhabdus alkalitolerans]|uniref:Chromosome partition protein Smc n=1 Tax=Pelagirhabdus alkalitolerans TaxID=1612202 RepID=A0A1G6H4I0_9BACI|nr:chromosome segregation protein SMC [Pelagirhabdus alkalitolerans]SDB88326.1 condensin subunit Smc [Pelagirhabdus alkalitolerans]
MFLKKLESVGFKSFAERISVDFVPGITAVVGPNGSGKSNVTDAIRWVLGEQSAKSLRGSKMEDVIFQGSDTRKPLNMAEVTLVLDNKENALPIDYQEVSVTRRVYRSGESEFFLNKQSCRLKDIIDLFLDSGLGREAFSIIGQGKIEEILSSKAEERRIIFEEAAGVLKYKNRKKKAEYKLAETQENLNRVEDIIYELEGQLEPLKQQSSLAKEYLNVKDQLKESEVALIRTEIESLHEEWQQLLKDIDKYKKKEEQYDVEVNVKNSQIEKQQADIEALDRGIETDQEQLLAATQTLEKLTGEKNLLSERAKHSSDNQDKLKERQTLLKQQLEKINEEKNKEKRELEKIKQSKFDIDKQLKEERGKLNQDVQSIEREIESLKADYIDLLNDRATEKHRIETINDRLSQLDQQQESKQQVYEEQEHFISTLENEKESNEENKVILMAEMEELKNKLEKDEVTLNDLSKQFDEMKSKLDQGYRQIDKLSSRKETLEEMKEDFQGFYHGVKAVLKARDHKKLSHIEGAVIELIDIPKGYLTAVETALAAQAQHVVARNEASARKAITYLKETKQGRATFIPMDVIKPRPIPADVLTKVKQHHGFVTLASEAVQIDRTYQSVADYLLGRTIIAKSLKDANQLASIVNRMYRIVTLDGDIVNPGGTMTGGAKKNTQQSLFTREQELQQLSETLKGYHQRANDYKKQVDQTEQKMNQLTKAIHEQRSIINKQQEKIDEVDKIIENNQFKLDHYKEQLTQRMRSDQQAKDERTQLSEKLKEQEKAQTRVEERITVVEREIEDKQTDKTNLEENKDAIVKNVQTLEVKQAELKQSLTFQEEKLDKVNNQVESVSNELAEIDKERDQIEAFENALEQIEDLDETIKVKKQEKDALAEHIQAKRQERLTLTTQLQETEAHNRTIRQQRKALSEKRQSMEVKANRLDVELDNRLKRLEETYEMSYDYAKETYSKVEDVKKAQLDVKLLKRTIDEMGTVNLGSIEEYERINERFSFLKDQQTDLLEAKETLHQVISEMDEEMQRRFEETFEQIQIEFTEVFKKLFGGGHAQLKLTDPNQLLTTGVEIKAQPPGKKAQQLGLLSGGERALTAIALLFSILRVRPVPFCVLDEVEAALDEANVSRFSQYLNEFSQDTQFIVITHRKGTMEGADVLYGVTMQESGVSRFVSVKLEETASLIES